MFDDALLVRISLVVALAGICALLALDFLDGRTHLTIAQAESLAGSKAWVKAKATWHKEQETETFFGLEDESGKITATIFRPRAEERELLKGGKTLLVKGVAKKSGNSFIFLAEEARAWKP